MNNRQICAGQVPPKTVMRVLGGSIGIKPSWKPTQTAAVSWGIGADEPRVRMGVGGAGLADLRSSDDGRPARAEAHDLLQDVVGHASRPAVRAPAWAAAWLAKCTLPSASVTLITGTGITCWPPVASVPYALDISRVLDSFVPSTADR